MSSRWFFFFFTFLFVLSACTAEPQTAVPPTPLSTTTTTLPIATAVPPTVTEPAINTPTATAVAENTPTAIPAATATAVVSTPFLNCLPDSLTAEAELTERAWQVTYVVDDQLWLRESGQAAIALVRQSGIYAVKLSADGALLAFARKSDENSSELWLVEGSGQSIRLSGEEGISGLVRFVDFSDDNRLVAFTRSMDVEYTGDLWVVATDGSGVRQLVSEDDMMVLADSEPGPGNVDFTHVAWVPGTHRLTYIPTLRYQGDYTQVAYDPLPSVDADTGEQSLFLKPGVGGYITYSPDGMKMAVARPDKLSVMDIGNREQPLATLNYPILPLPLGTFIPQPIWAADSASLLLPVLAEEGVVPDFPPWPPLAIWRVSVDGTAPAVVGHSRDDQFLASFSPDLKWLTYFAQDEDGPDGRLHLASVDLAVDVSYDAGDYLSGVQWATDSRHFVYVKSGQLYLGDVCGEAVPIEDVPEASFAGWLDGRYFLLLRGLSLASSSQTTWELWLSSVDGNTVLLAAMGEQVAFDWFSKQ